MPWSLKSFYAGLLVACGAFFAQPLGTITAGMGMTLWFVGMLVAATGLVIFR